MKTRRFNKEGMASGSRRGFALVSSISIMILLVVVLLGMITLSSHESRMSLHSKAKAEAQSNARMALMMALGRLQDLAGADQSVSARADIRRDADPARQYWTGFWSTRGWDPLNPTDRDFLGWGVSGVESELTEDSVSQELTGEQVTLVGDGSVSDPAQEVAVREMEIEKDGRVTGSYGWWIGDEGIKASYKVPRVAQNGWNRAAVFGTAAAAGISAIGFDGHGDLTEEEVEKSSLTRQSIAMPNNDPEVPKEFFHDVTPSAVSLLTDTRLGGVQRDLSTAFELPIDEFNDIEEFHAAGENNLTNMYGDLGSVYEDPRFYNASNAPDLGYVCEIPNGGGIVRGVSWDYLRNHYRLYKRELEEDPWSRAMQGVQGGTVAARGSYPHSYSGNKGGANDVGGDSFGYHFSEGHLYNKASFGFYGRIRPLNMPRGAISGGDIQKRLTVARSPKLTPIVVRLSLAIGMVKRPLNSGADWSLALSFDPYLTITNPYNVPITFESVGVWCAKFNPLKVGIEYTDDSGSKQTVNIDKYFSGNYYSFGTFNMILDPAQGPYTLEPGETRVVSPAKISDKHIAYNYVTTMRGGFPYSEDSGFYMANNTNIKPRDGTSVKVTLRGRASNWGATDRFVVYLYHQKDHGGANRDLYTFRPPRNMFGDEDILDQPLIANIGASANDGKTQPNFLVSREVSTSQIPDPGETGLYLGVLDLKMKTTKEDFPSLTVNPRGGAYDTRDWDGLERSNPQWSFDLTAVDDLSQLQLVADPDGGSFWGEGRTVADGSEHTVLYEVPELPMTSLAQFQHANTGVTGSSGSMQIGNSFPHPGLSDLAQIAGQRTTVSGGYSSAASQVLADMSWASNDRLWDRYFFSGMNWGSADVARYGVSQQYSSQQEAVDALVAQDRSAAWPLQNPRIGLFSSDLTDTQKEELKEYDKIGRYLAVFGGFNVNSTSVRAWKAIFSSLREVDVTYMENGSRRTKTVEQAFSRFMLPVTDSGEVFGSFQELSDGDIEGLAEAMVEQVKLRGPFMGLGDFVNRRLTGENIDGTDVGAVGALQAAIEAAGLNDDATEAPTAGNLENKTYQVDNKSRSISNYAGASKYLLQGDVLNSIGGILRARSDTFVIRAYGSAKNAQGQVVAEAWCEAVVQRTPEWCEATDERATRQRAAYPDSSGSTVVEQFEENPALPAVNQRMGRKFKIQSFKWLSPEEV